jgi:Histone deacetylase domain.
MTGEDALTKITRPLAQMVAQAARRWGAGRFGILEGGYNHRILGLNVAAFLEGLEAQD